MSLGTAFHAETYVVFLTCDGGLPRCLFPDCSRSKRRVPEPSQICQLMFLFPKVVGRGDDTLGSLLFFPRPRYLQDENRLS